MASKFEIGNIKIGIGEEPLVIPEIGINHGGSLEIAKRMVDAAHRAGAKLVKHQTHIVMDEMSHAAKSVIPGNSDESIYDIMDRCALNEEEEYELKCYTEQKGMVFLSTPFSRAAADRLESFGVLGYKIGSGEMNNYPLIKYVASFGKPMIVSTGMNDIPAIKKAVGILENYKVPYALLHTTNLYPTPPELVRLGAMREMMETFPDVPVGLSDHTRTNTACIAAMALGASVVERHFTDAISKFAHVHFVCTEEAKERLIQMGEEIERIYVIGSPDIDIMVSKNLPKLWEAKKRYDITFEDYAIFMYHPVTTEYTALSKNVREIIDAVMESDKNYIVIYPNNDMGSEIILHEYERLKEKERFKLFPSVRFEYFLTLLKNAKFMIGNSSAGVREAGIYGIPAIDIGTRQQGRYYTEKSKNILHTLEDKKKILEAVKNIESYTVKTEIFGDGNSTMRFYNIVRTKEFWAKKIQKHFVDFQM